jgi:hypothetical protein
LTIVSSERTQSFRASADLLPRLARLVREAAKQAERARWPAITGPVPLSDLLRTESAGNRLILDSQGEMFPAVLAPLETALLVGPEGGWSAPNLAEAFSAGWIPVSLAAGILRAETAAVAALALARSALARSSPPSHREYSPDEGGRRFAMREPAAVAQQRDPRGRRVSPRGSVASMQGRGRGAARRAPAALGDTPRARCRGASRPCGSPSFRRTAG